MDRAGVETGAKMFVAVSDRSADCAKITAAHQFFEPNVAFLSLDVWSRRLQISVQSNSLLEVNNPENF